MKKVEGYIVNDKFFENEQDAKIYEQQCLLKTVLQPSNELKVKLERTAGHELYGIMLTSLIQKFINHQVDFLRAVAIVKELNELDQRIGYNDGDSILYGLIHSHNFVKLEPLFNEDLSPLLDKFNTNKR